MLGTRRAQSERPRYCPCGVESAHGTRGWSSGGCGWALLFTVDQRKAALVPREDGRVVVPGPPAKPGCTVIIEGLLYLGAGVHNKGAMLRDRFTDRLPLQHQNAGRLGLVCVAHPRLVPRPQLHHVARLHRHPAHLQTLPLVVVERPVDCPSARSGWQRHLPSRRHLQQPNRNVGARLRCPRLRRRLEPFFAHQLASPYCHLDSPLVQMDARDVFPPMHHKRGLRHFRLAR
mmetsp:Transcript_19534/g.34845  ORF Transcript_19534/g.34845 Transcript_19534/m.34845 type:complete len:231 (+) Transcript_19534:173-865(+)